MMITKIKRSLYPTINIEIDKMNKYFEIFEKSNNNMKKYLFRVLYLYKHKKYIRILHVI